MSFPAIGDLAQYMTTRRQSANLQSQISRLTHEMSTGRTSDVTRAVNASFSLLSDVEHQTALNSAFKSAATEASVQAGAMQAVLESVQNQVTVMSDAATFAGATSNVGIITSVSTTARDSLNSIVAALNVSVAGRPIFAGTDVDKLPLVGSDELMDAVINAAAPATDANSVIAAIDTFFDTPGGPFETDIYVDGDEDLSAFQLGRGESVKLSIRADDMDLRVVLKSAVMASMAGDSSLPLNPEERSSILQKAASLMAPAKDNLIQMRSELGVTESRIDQSIARISAEKTSLTIARNELTSVDLYETATALEQAQFQLETIYTLTARTSRLNLVNFL